MEPIRRHHVSALVKALRHHATKAEAMVRAAQAAIPPLLDTVASTSATGGHNG